MNIIQMNAWHAGVSLLVLLLIRQPAVGQVYMPEEEAFDKTHISSDIFRAMLAGSTDNTVALTGCYEREIKRPFTVVLKAGPAAVQGDLAPGVVSSNDYQYTLKIVASAELRYYFNLRRRIRHEKITSNFSAGYLSLEPYVLSRALLFRDKLDIEEKPGSTGGYINIGFQKQQNRTTSYGLFFGTRFPGPIYSHSVTVLDIIRGGVTLARVF